MSSMPSLEELTGIDDAQLSESTILAGNLGKKNQSLNRPAADYLNPFTGLNLRYLNGMGKVNMVNVFIIYSLTYT